MNQNTAERAKRLLASIGEIADTFLDETELADIAMRRVRRRRVVQYSAIGVGAASAVGIAAVILIRRPKRAAQIMETV